MRLFTAIYPDIAALDHLDMALEMMSIQTDVGLGFRWVPREQRHLTLGFHGEVPAGIVPEYVRALTSSLHNAEENLRFSVDLAGAGSFFAKTLWIGVGQGGDEIRNLSHLTDQAAADAGVRPDSRAGARPHLTLARVSSHRGGESRRRGGKSRGRSDANQETGGAALVGVDSLARALSIYRGPTWPVKSICVVESKLGQGRSGGPIHETLAEIPLLGLDSWM